MTKSQLDNAPPSFLIEHHALFEIHSHSTPEGILPNNNKAPEKALEDTKDLEKQDDGGEGLAHDDKLITWENETDPENPRNWSKRQKWTITVLTSCFTLLTSLSSSMISPALPAMSADLGNTNEVAELMIVSIFVLAFGIGPLFFAPLSEVYGRKLVLQLTNLFYLIFNTACGMSRTISEMMVFRFFAGLSGSATMAVGGGILADVWSTDERGKAVGVYTLMPLLGPALGPLAAGFIVYSSTWRWGFYAVSIADVVVLLTSTLLFKETYPRAILHHKAKRLRRETNNDDLKTTWEKANLSLAETLWTAFQRPIKLISTQPIVQFCAVYMAFLYGLMYLVLSTFPRLWRNQYQESVQIGGLNYISAGLGFSLAAQLNARMSDRIYHRLKGRNGGVGKPEYRIPVMVISSILVPIGIFVYAWTAQVRAFWLWPNLGIFILCGSMIISFQSMQIYLVQTYTTYAASALAAATILRSLAGFGFPLFATSLYDKLDYGWGNSVLGFVACGIGWPAVYVFWYYGEHLRNKSPFAAGEDTSG